MPQRHAQGSPVWRGHQTSGVCLFPDSLASVGTGLPLADLHGPSIASHLATPTLRESSQSPRREPSPQGSILEDEEVRPETSTSAKETIAEAFLLILHLMADRMPEDEKTILSDPAGASLLATDLDESSGHGVQRLFDSALIRGSAGCCQYQTETSTSKPCH